MCLLRPLRFRLARICHKPDLTDMMVIDVNEVDDSLVPESCLVEDDKFVGCTAKFSDEGKIVPLRPDLYPKEYPL